MLQNQNTTRKTRNKEILELNYLQTTEASFEKGQNVLMLPSQSEFFACIYLKVKQSIYLGHSSRAI